MNDRFLPTEEELDALLAEAPGFDLEAVKDRVLDQVLPPAKGRRPLRGLLIAAVVCALSVTALAAAGGTPIARLFHFQKAQMPEAAVSSPG